MLKPVLAVAATGVLGLILWKILAVLLLPMLGVALAVVFTVLKFALLAGLVLFAIWLWRRFGHRETGAA
jgi:hypothetical protein